jgi:hypothetical protein
MSNEPIGRQKAKRLLRRGGSEPRRPGDEAASGRDREANMLAGEEAARGGDARGPEPVTVAPDVNGPGSRKRR